MVFFHKLCEIRFRINYIMLIVKKMLFSNIKRFAFNSRQSEHNKI